MGSVQLVVEKTGLNASRDRRGTGEGLLCASTSARCSSVPGPRGLLNAGLGLVVDGCSVAGVAPAELQ